MCVCVCGVCVCGCVCVCVCVWVCGCVWVCVARVKSGGFEMEIRLEVPELVLVDSQLLHRIL